MFSRKILFGAKNSVRYILESNKLRAPHTLVPYKPLGLRSLVPDTARALRALVPNVLCAWRSQAYDVPNVFREHVPHVPRTLLVAVPDVHYALHTLLPHLSCTLSVLMLYVWLCSDTSHVLQLSRLASPVFLIFLLFDFFTAGTMICNYYYGIQVLLKDSQFFIPRDKNERFQFSRKSRAKW